MSAPIEFSNGYISLTEEGFFYVTMKDESYSTITSVKESHKIMESLLPKGNVYILVDSGERSNSENEVFEYLQKCDFTKRVKCQAVVARDLPTRLMGNLFLRFIKHKRNIKIFGSYQAAKTWLISKMNVQEKSKKTFLFV